jgi:hypothetical protein
MSFYKKYNIKAKFILLFLAIILCCCGNPDKKSIVRANAIETGDSIFYNIYNPQKDRILLFEKEFFVWIYEKNLDRDTTLDVLYGKYQLKNDTIFFAPPDSNMTENSVFCYCKTKYDVEKRFQFYNKNNNYPPDQLSNVYMRVFKKKMSVNKQIGEFGNFFAVREHNPSEFILDKKKYILLK